MLWDPVGEKRKACLITHICGCGGASGGVFDQFDISALLDCMHICLGQLHHLKLSVNTAALKVSAQTVRVLSS